MQELVIRIKPRNGKDDITVNEVIKALCPDAVPGVEKWIVQQVEGDSLEIEALSVAAQMIIKKHIVDPLAEIPLKMVRDIVDAWKDAKAPVEKLLQHKFAQCPECGTYALADAFHNDQKFICPSCESNLIWRFKADPKHPEGGRYTLERK
jgi:hypothetical protein